MGFSRQTSIDHGWGWARCSHFSPQESYERRPLFSAHTIARTVNAWSQWFQESTALDSSSFVENVRLWRLIWCHHFSYIRKLARSLDSINVRRGECSLDGPFFCIRSLKICIHGVDAWWMNGKPCKLLFSKGDSEGVNLNGTVYPLPVVANVVPNYDPANWSHNVLQQIVKGGHRRWKAEPKCKLMEKKAMKVRSRSITCFLTSLLKQLLHHSIT